MFDFEHSIDEDRYIAIGKVGEVLLWYLRKEKIQFVWFQPDLQQIRKGACIMTKTFIIDSGQKPTEEQLKEIEDAKNIPIIFDEDCEELSPPMIKAFKSAVVQRNRKKKA